MPPALDSREYALALYEIQLFATPDGDLEHNAIGTFWFFPGGSVTETGAWINKRMLRINAQPSAIRELCPQR